ncbi:MAG: hypothetical protein AVDCRST_MAG56-4873 [uncultured Cytophagales bacterium]|uniref:Amidoligase enzyme n=1 Tax=uncultured Cytophagales bacterium TaxID=158755 RepID=A0A6J4K197_9SPHI|nr:MAG: hypothetical protein AVDCRST_MAG56-4873 [uncultured Cytophagales bacterium]
MTFNLPPVLYNAKGEIRKAGFELEFSNVGVEDSVRLIQELYGGRVHRENRFLQRVLDTRIGDFTVEFDLRLLTEKKYKQPFDSLNIDLQGIKLGESTLEESVEAVLESVVGKLFPYEIVTPPVPCTELAQFEKLRQALHDSNAKGTEAFPTNVFGTHINVEVPDGQAGTILRYLQAFLLLYPWLLEKGETDLARRMSPFINPYPDEYVQRVLSPGYGPDLDGLIADYHQYSPDRNRPLDLYPLFAALHPQQIAAFTNLGKVKARETFHYRLPNSSVSQPGWTLAQEWNLWVVIEELANDPEKMARMGEAYLALKKDTLIGFGGKWTKQIDQWLSLRNAAK